jgi:hypothetical protein
MDTNTAIVIIIVILAVVAIAGFLRFGRQGSARLQGPGGIGLNVSGTNEPTPGARIADSESSEGGALAEDVTGRGAAIERTKVKDDLIASSSASSQQNDPKV